MRSTLFKTNGVFYRDTYYAHVSFLVEVRAAYRAIEISFRYDPLFCESADERQREEMRQALAEQIYRTDEPFVTECMDRAYPIKNGITVAVRGPEQWLGEHHAYTGHEELVLGERPSPGFFAVPNREGQYEFVLHVFGIYTPECRYSLEIVGVNEE
ncbi:MAG: hypothetical protein IKE30_00175 [Clostridia bacterium]|nr:hypothetical protein [Clostridia bacterium]